MPNNLTVKESFDLNVLFMTMKDTSRKFDERFEAMVQHTKLKKKLGLP